jgi:hypothetical protein
MSAAVAAPRAPRVQPVLWRRLGWVAWRRYRASLVTIAVLLGVVALYVLLRGLRMRDAYATVEACVPASSAACRFAFENFHRSYGDIGFAGGILVFVPGLIGAFAGAPLLARELETGTFRFAWTQGAGRLRWVVGLVVPGAVGVALVSVALGSLISWYERPLVATGVVQRLHPSVFPITGIAVAGWGLLAFSAGVMAGLLLRRVVPALVATLIAWTGVALVASDLRRTHYEAPLVTRLLQLSRHDLPMQQWWTHGGLRVGADQINRVLQAIGAQSANGGGNFVVGPGGGSIDPVRYLLQHGYVQWTSYQPAARFWTFQVIEFGWLALLSLLLLGAAVWLVRRHGA